MLDFGGKKTRGGAAFFLKSAIFATLVVFIIILVCLIIGGDSGLLVRRRTAPPPPIIINRNAGARRRTPARRPSAQEDPARPAGGRAGRRGGGVRRVEWRRPRRRHERPAAPPLYAEEGRRISPDEVNRPLGGGFVRGGGIMPGAAEFYGGLEVAAFPHADDAPEGVVGSALQLPAVEEEERGRGVRVEALQETPLLSLNDLQNSHDVSVNASKRAILQRLRSETRPAVLSEILADLEAGSDMYSRDPVTGRPRPSLVNKAFRVVRLMSLSSTYSSAVQATDVEALNLVWGRADDPRNAGRRLLMRQAVFDALVDCWERGGAADDPIMVCVDGRISRFLGSLAHLDHDERNWDIHRAVHYENELYGRVSNLIRLAAVEAAESDGAPLLQKVGRSYLAATPSELQQVVEGGLDSETELEWLTSTRARVDREVDEYVAEVNGRIPGAIPPRNAAVLKKNALAALGYQL